MIGRKRAGKNHKLPGGARANTPKSQGEARRRGTVDESGLNMTNISPPVIDSSQTPDSGASGCESGSAGDSGGGSSDGGGCSGGDAS